MMESTLKRVRVLFNDTYIVDTIQATYVWEHKNYPQSYFQASDVKEASISKDRDVTDGEGGAFLGSLSLGDRRTDRVLLFKKGPLAGLVKLEFAAMDAWFEEETRIYVHPKDPYKRVDILPSFRHIKVEIDGHVIAESGSNMFLFETSLPARYYLPQTSVNWKYLSPSETVSRCPYKGEAHYYNVIVGGKTHEDIIWWYRYPTAESIQVTGMLCFYNEKVDIWVDGVKEERPKTHFA